MKDLTTLQLKILRTKKRLSDSHWNQSKIAISLMGVLVTLSFILRSVSIASDYGIIEVELPVVSNPIKDQSYHHFKETPDTMITKKTPMIILTSKAYLYSDIEGFSKKILHIRDKFQIPHHNGYPNLNALTDSLQKWIKLQTLEKNINYEGIVVFMPSSQIPIYHIIKSIAALKSLPIVSHVVLSTGLL